MGHFGEISHKARSIIQQANCDNCEKTAKTTRDLIAMGRSCASKGIKHAVSGSISPVYATSQSQYLKET